MIVKMFTVFDSKAGVFGAPFVSVNLATGMRSFKVLCMDGTSMVSKSPGDFALYEIGTFNDEGGIVEAHTAPVFVVQAASMMEQDNNA